MASNFALLDVSLPDVARLVAAMVQARDAVEGDIFHRSLSIDENAQFAGPSRRVEIPMDPSLSVANRTSGSNNRWIKVGGNVTRQAS
jgi:hypothetical protein